MIHKEEDLLKVLEPLLALGILVRYENSLGDAEFYRGNYCAIFKFDGSYYVKREFADEIS